MMKKKEKKHQKQKLLLSFWFEHKFPQKLLLFLPIASHSKLFALSPSLSPSLAFFQVSFSNFQEAAT